MSTHTQHKFPPSGINYFWFLNDYCDDAAIDRQIAGFHRERVAAVCLHPRDGLLLPYGSTDWFAFVRRTAEKLAAKGIEVWIYDEDPYPSGNAGGRLALDHPELIAKTIVMHKAVPEAIDAHGLWCFPAKGSLLLCGLFSEEQTTLNLDLTERVGMVRRTWEELKGWDSRFYYPATPLYICDRAMANNPEYAVQAGKVPAGQVLVAFTVENTPCERWNYYVDSLNPQATAKFIEYTHEKYRRHVGDMFGKEITAIFTDEAKYHSYTPWTPGLAEDFQACYGYDLKPRLFELFSDVLTNRGMLTRLNYREWCGNRFEQAWLKPVAAWCRKHNLAMIGHLSPEEDPVSQAGAISNLMPLQKHFSLAGLDLIIPAVGDSRHPLLNIGIVSAVSAAQQQQMPGVMSESLACSGRDFTVAGIRRILNWQTVMGMTTPVVHGAFHSLRAEREYECPPDFSPSSRFGDALAQLHTELAPIQDMLISATQLAPVAVLWPIKSFQLFNRPWQAECGGLRAELTDLILACLEAQVGVHLLDEADLLCGKVTDGSLTIGNASYTHIIIPGSTVWKQATWDLLVQEDGRGFKVYQYGTRPKYLEAPADIRETGENSFAELSAGDIKTKLPRLLQLQAADAGNIRVSGWRKDNDRFFLLCQLAEGFQEAVVNSEKLQLSNQNITIMSLNQKECL